MSLPAFPDPKFNTTFLMTYKSFTTLDTLFELLTERFALQPPENIGKDLEQWTKMKKAIVQARSVSSVPRPSTVLSSSQSAQRLQVHADH